MNIVVRVPAVLAAILSIKSLPGHHVEAFSVLSTTTRTPTVPRQITPSQSFLFRRKICLSSAEVDSDAVEVTDIAEIPTPEIDLVVDTLTPSSSSSARLPPSESRPPVRRKYEKFLWFYNLQEYNINYRVEGPVDGTPILLVHGFGANVNHFRHQFPALVEAGYRVYAIDLLGFGASDKPSKVGYSIELFVDLLTEFIQTMKHNHLDDNRNDADDNRHKPWMIAGNSIGGLCSLSVAEKLPELIQGVVLFNCAGGMTGFRYDDVPFILRPVLWLIQYVALGPSWGGRFFQKFKSRDNVEGILRQSGVYRDQTHVNEELFEILLAPSDDEGAQDVFLEVFAGPPGPTPESILPSIQCPILALWGSADPWTPVDAGAHPGSQFGQYCNTDFSLHVLPGAGHCPHDEVPDAVHAIMIPWMEETKKKKNPMA